MTLDPEREKALFAAFAEAVEHMEKAHYTDMPTPAVLAHFTAAAWLLANDHRFEMDDVAIADPATVPGAAWLIAEWREHGIKGHDLLAVCAATEAVLDQRRELP